MSPPTPHEQKRDCSITTGPTRHSLHHVTRCRQLFDPFTLDSTGRVAQLEGGARQRTPYESRYEDQKAGSSAAERPVYCCARAATVGLTGSRPNELSLVAGYSFGSDD